MEEAKNLEVLIKQVKFSQEEDSLVWLISKKPYAVNKAMEIFSGSGGEVSWHFIWKLKIPHKIKLFLWKVHLSILPTSLFLLARGIITDSEGICAFCRRDLESIEHLFFHCHFSRILWSDIFAWWKVYPVQHGMLHLSDLWKLSNNFSSKSLKSAWRIMVSATMWILWLARNQCVFDSKNVDSKNLLCLAKFHALEWCQIQNILHKKSIHRWNSNPVSAISEAEGIKFKELFSCGSKLIGFCDGSWKEKSSGIEAGLGGLIFKETGEAILSFYGPSQAANSFDSEWEALTLLGKTFVDSEWSSLQLTIFTDSRQVYCKFLELSIKAHHLGNSKEHAFLSCQNIRVKYISSELNFRADLLAKRGAKSKELKLFRVHKRGQ